MQSESEKWQSLSQEQRIAVVNGEATMDEILARSEEWTIEEILAREG